MRRTAHVVVEHSGRIERDVFSSADKIASTARAQALQRNADRKGIRVTYTVHERVVTDQASVYPSNSAEVSVP